MHPFLAVTKFMLSNLHLVTLRQVTFLIYIVLLLVRDWCATKGLQSGVTPM